MELRINGLVFVYGDNQSVWVNTTELDSALKKKSNSIAFHSVQEGIARNKWRTAYIGSNENTSDLLTKYLPSGEKRQMFCDRILYHVYTEVVMKFGTNGGRRRIKYSYLNYLFDVYIYLDTVLYWIISDHLCEKN